MRSARRLAGTAAESEEHSGYTYFYLVTSIYHYVYTAMGTDPVLLVSNAAERGRLALSRALNMDGYPQ
ncbi:hypothetical protein [Alteribacter aurantiacus]|uniref:hypothetical protein n=1 Tax=Alteribacter aurantiacus TaxID=254410 RepID=UPI000478D66A|nr:hypothetical protein [Alteribacter aurantiacus]